MIAQTFPEDTRTAIRTFKGESGLQQWYVDGSIVSSHTNDYGLCQVNAATWEHVAVELDLDYRNNIEEHIQLCRHIYDEAGQQWTPWVYYLKHIAMR